MKYRVRSFAAVGAIALLLGCATNRNDPTATYVLVNGSYEITMTGLRENMAHDPISFVLRGSSPLKATICVPRITGQVDAAEIFPTSGGYRYFGKIDFSGSRMVVAIHYDNTDAKRIAPFTFNGEYVLRAVQGSP